MLKMREEPLLRLLALAREGFSRGWDGIDARDRLDEIDQLQWTLVGDIYDPGFGDEKPCACGHTYYRHFDSYDQMRNIGCKYCNGSCQTWRDPVTLVGHPR